MIAVLQSSTRFCAFLLIASQAFSAPIFWGSADEGAEIKDKTIVEETAPVNETLAKEIQPNTLTGARLLKARGQETPGIEIRTGSNFDQVRVTGDGMTKHDVIRLENPARIVIDLFGVKGSNNTIPAAGSKFMRQVRSAEHSDKTRIVLDVVESAEKTVAYDVTDSNGTLAITLASQSNLQDAIQTANTAPNANMRAQFKDPFNGNENSMDVAASGMQPTLEAVKIESVGTDSNILVAEMQNAGTYTFSKTTPSEYVLNLEGSSMSGGVQDSVIAKPGMGKIRSVRAVKNSTGVQLRIFADPSTMLKVKAEGNKILVADYKDGAMSGDLRAQALITDESPAATPKLGKKDASPTFDISLDQPDSTKEEIQLTRPTAGPSLVKEEVLPKKAPSAAPVIKVEEPVRREEKQDAFTPPVQARNEIEVTDDLQAEFGDLEEKTYTGRLISLDLQDTDIDNALRIIAEVSNLNIIASDDVTGKVTLRLIDVPWDQALDVILKTNGLDKVQDGNVVRIAPVEKLRAEWETQKQAVKAEEELEPLKVSYLRVSYAKAAELQPLVETVVTERGTVTFDERTNQLIVKDIEKGLKNVSKLVEKLDLRTPQVLIETQIVEAQRRFVREIGAELGFSVVRSPETGNALGYNFPNSIQVGGSATGATGGVLPGNIGSFYPSTDQSSALSFLFGSADGTKNLSLRLSQGEKDGLVKVVSRPSVAVTNNQPAIIKSVEKIRIRLPQGGGVTVNQGNGAGGNGGGQVAAETIEVGIVLNVTAQASPDYFVLLDVNAKSSTLGARDRGVDTIPPEVERSATSSVLVSSGQTFAMGGIYKLSENDAISGVPFLKDIPFLGQFFRQSSVTDSDEELIFFITPRIIEGSFDDAAMKSVS